MSDFRFALRQLLNARGFTVVAVLTLALGIGACTSIFTAVNSILLRPLPYRDSGQLVVVSEILVKKGMVIGVAPATFLGLQDTSGVFDGIAAWDFRSYNITGQGDPFRVYAQHLTTNFFSLLGVQPMLGRNFLPDEGESRVLILSHRVWKSRFAGRTDIVGQVLQLDDHAFTVVGVMPESFQFDPRIDLFTPRAFTAASRGDFERNLAVLGRLRLGLSVAQASSSLAVVSNQFSTAAPGSYQDYGLRIVPLMEAQVSGVRPMTLMLLGAVGCLLLIACTNIANLLLARATSRRKEIALRAALGASRGRIFRQLLSESLLLAVLGGLLGLLAARWIGQAISASMPSWFPRAGEISMDATVYGFTCVLTLVTGVIFGLAPAIQASRVDVNATIKDGGGRGTSAAGGAHRLRSLLVISEVALAFVLLTGAGLFFRALIKVQGNPLGFETKTTYSNVLLLSEKKYPTPRQRAEVIERYLERLGSVPGVAAAAFTNHTSPTGGAPSNFFSIVGRPPLEASQRPTTFNYGVTPDYFKTFLIPLLRGRTFTARDNLGAPRVAIINEELATKYFPGEDPLGKQITLHIRDQSLPREIIGVVGNVRQNSAFMPMLPQVYEPYAQIPELSTTLIVRSAGSSLDLRALAAAVHAIDPDMPLDAMYPMADGFATSLAGYRIAISLFVIFSVVALLLAALGIYGVMAYNISQRTGEIGIRMALGAQHRDVVKLMLVQGGRQVLIGLVCGVAGSLAVGQLLASELYQTSPYDPLTLVTITVLLTSVAFVANWLPARRATRVDPMVALRAE